MCCRHKLGKPSNVCRGSAALGAFELRPIINTHPRTHPRNVSKARHSEWIVFVLKFRWNETETRNPHNRKQTQTQTHGSTRGVAGKAVCLSFLLLALACEVFAVFFVSLRKPLVVRRQPSYRCCFGYTFFFRAVVYTSYL